MSVMVSRMRTFEAARRRRVALERSVPDDADIEDMSVVKQSNPASWIAEDGLREQREAVHELAFRRYHCDQWTAAEAYWLPPGAWQACADIFDIEPGERVFLGVDIGGERAASAIAIVTEDLRVQAEIFQGDRAVLEVVDRVRGSRASTTSPSWCSTRGASSRARASSSRTGCASWSSRNPTRG